MQGLVEDVLRRKGVLWRQQGRVHLRLHSNLAPSESVDVTGLEEALEACAGVAWARLHPRLGCVVVQAELNGVELDLDSVFALLHSAELSASLTSSMHSRHPERHPGDRAPLLRTAIEIGLDVSSIVLGRVVRHAHIESRLFEIDLAALVELVSGVPQIRKGLERVLTIAGAELALGVARALVQSLLQSDVGPAVATFRHSLRIRELLARRHLWEELEPRLCAEPSTFADAGTRRLRRPRPAPKGPIEPYTDKASMASLLAFAAGLLFTRDPESASAPIFAALPKPARYGRDAFASHLGNRLAKLGVLVIEPHVLRRLDRIDCALVDPRLLDAEDSELVSEVLRSIHLRCEILKTGDDPIASCHALQLAGHAVCVVGLGAWEAFAAGDCNVSLLPEGAQIPWRADLICTRGMASLTGVLRGIACAHQVSEEGLALSLVETAFSGGLASSGLRERTTRRIMAASSLLTVLAMANGVRRAHLATRASEKYPAPSGTKPTVQPPWHSLDQDEVLETLGVTPDGLSSAEADRRRPPPPLPPSRSSMLREVLLEELATPMTPVLAIGAGLSLAMGNVGDAALIATALAINAGVSTVQRYRTETVLRAMTRVERIHVRVRRSDLGSALVPSDMLALGDIIELRAGHVVPADCRILAATALEADESSLTGESLPVAKSPAPTLAQAIAERASMLYDDTAIAAGEATAVIVALGENTESQRASRAAQASARASGFERRIRALTAKTAPLAAAAGVAVGAASIVRGRQPAEVLSAGVALAVAAIPEGLPLLATIAQLAAASRLSEHGVLVREPKAVETLGRVNVLCADKTGTLTEGRIRLHWVSNGLQRERAESLGPYHRQILSAGLRATPSSSGSVEIPHLTDRALVEGAQSASVTSHEGLADWQRLTALPFEPARGYHASLARYSGGKILSVKGAPELLLPLCTYWRLEGREQPLSESERASIELEARELAGQGYRVLAVAERPAETSAPVERKRLRDLRFCGFLAFADPVRASARAAVSDMRRAGVEVIMVTGDHPSTAGTIARELGIANDHAVMTGPQLEHLSDEELQELVLETAVFARITPIQKVRIVAALQSRGKVVAMTGDGANDAPAIRRADVGIALGQTSTAAARAAADLIVTDEHIETIVNAALEGRALWASVRDAIAILVGGNLGEISYTLIGALIAGESPLNARQLLLVNLFTDTLPALAIALRPPPDKPPEQLSAEGPEASLGTLLSRDIAYRAAITTVSASAAWASARVFGGARGASTAGLVTLTGTQLMQTLVVGGRSRLTLAASLGSFAAMLGIVQTPVLSQAFGCRPLGPLGLAQVAGATGLGTLLALVHHWGLLRSPQWTGTPTSARVNQPRQSAEGPLPAPP